MAPPQLAPVLLVLVPGAMLGPADYESLLSAIQVGAMKNAIISTWEEGTLRWLLHPFLLLPGAGILWTSHPAPAAG